MRFPDKKKLYVGFAIALVTALVINTAFYFGAFEELEFKMRDVRLRLFSPGRHVPDEVATILVDENSLKAMNPIAGRWPWPRSVHADVIDFLSMGGARAVLFDILFAENERVPGAKKGVLGPNDMALVKSAKSAGNVYNAVQLLEDTEDEYNKGLLGKPLPGDFVERFSARNISGMAGGRNNVYYTPFPQLYRASKGIGVVEFAPDRDGIYRKTSLFRDYQGPSYPVLSMAALLDVLKPAQVRFSGDELVLEGIQNDSLLKKYLKGKRKTASGNDGRIEVLRIPLQRDGTYLINMYGDFKPYSMGGILASIQKIKMGELDGLPVNPEEFKDKIVFIGASAAGVEDLKATSINSKTPGVYLHASVLGNVIQNDFLRYTGKLITCALVFLLSFVVVFAILWGRQIFYKMGLPFLLAVIYVSVCFLLFKINMVFDIVTPVVAIVSSWMASFAYLSFTEGKEKKRIKNMLGQYVSPSILTSVLDRSSKDVLKAEVGTRERLTVLFSDIRGFTSMSEVMEAEQVVELLNGYLSGMVDVIFKYEGTLDKFIGDAIMAFWGAPIMLETHAKSAVEAAVGMKRQLVVFNQSLVDRGLPPIAIGVGINTGDVILGNIGSEKKLDYTVIGDNVNLASRMEGLTKEYHTSILITETTYEDIREILPCRIVDVVRVKGKKRPVKIYEPLAIPSDESETLEKAKRLAASTEMAFNLYLGRNWEKALDAYTSIGEVYAGNGVSDVFVERCLEYTTNSPPKDWDGVYTMLKK